MSDDKTKASDFWTDGVAYLATPYSKYPGGIEKAFIDASALASRLLVAGVNVYSPIAHTHPLAVHGGLDPLDHSIWLPFDAAMMAASSVLIVAHMEGWAESKGVAHEIFVFEAAKKPIFDLNPETLTMVRRVASRPDHVDRASEHVRRSLNHLSLALDAIRHAQQEWRR